MSLAKQIKPAALSVVNPVLKKRGCFHILFIVTNVQWNLDRDQNPHEAKSLKLDCSKARNILKWSPKLSLSVTLEWIIEWYRNYQQDKDMRYYTESEISRYEKLKT